MITLLSTALAGSFVFLGGGDFEAGKAISQEIRKPCVLLANSSQQYGKIAITWTQPKDFLRLATTKFGVRIGPNGGLSSLAWPRGFGDVSFSERYKGQYSEPSSPKSQTAGIVSLLTEGNQAFSLADIASLNLKKPLTWQRYLDRARLKVNVSNLDEKAFLLAVADAVGGSLIEKGASYRIVVDPVVYRAASVAMWQTELNRGLRTEDEELAADARYMIALLRATSDRILASAFEQPTKRWAQTWRPGTIIHTLAWKRAELKVQSMHGGPRNLFYRVASPDFPVYGYIEDSGIPTIGYRNPETREIVTL